LLRKVFNKTLWKFIRVVLTRIGIKRKYNIYGYTIDIDYSHLLPDYQNKHPRYDRFLPYFVNYLPEKSVVIDVGANVGDTLVGMVANNQNIEYLCIEASSEFFRSLEKNVELLKIRAPDIQVSLVNAFVGKNVDEVSLEGFGGTKHAVVGKGLIKSKPMHTILNEVKIGHERISLLKTDVDGFDWDVIRSSYTALSHNPYVFFELCGDIEQLGHYKDMFLELTMMGYSKFAFFDNYGQFIITTGDIKQICELIDYIGNQNFTQSTRTIYYYDVLAYTAEKDNEVISSINDYSSKFGF
jgi:FkbM family methyltransferase